MIRTNTTNLDAALTQGLAALEQNLDASNGYAPFFEIYADKGRTYTPHLASNVAGTSLYALTSGYAALGRDARDSAAVRGLAEYVTRMMYRPRNGKVDDFRAGNMMATGLPGDKVNLRDQGFSRYYISNLGAGLRGLLGLQLAVRDAEAVDRRYGRSAVGLFDVGIHNLMAYYVEDGQGGRAFDWEGYRRRLGLTGGRRVGLVEDSWSGAFQNTIQPLVLDALVEYAELRPGKTRNEALIRALRDYGLNGMFPQGQEASRKHGHMYEVVAGINAFSRLAARDRDTETLARMRAYFDGLFTMGAALQSGWVAERFYGMAAGLGQEGVRLNSDSGELNNTVQLIEAALRFGDQGLGMKYYQYAERALRGHVLPAQLQDVEAVVSAPGLRPILRGSFGFPAPYGVRPVQNGYYVGGYFADITAGTVAALARIRARAHQERGQDLFVPLLLDLKTAAAEISTPYATGRELVVRPRKAFDRILLRRPSWLKSVSGEAVALTDDWIVLSTGGSLKPVRLVLDLPENETSEDLNGRPLKTVWRGDSVLRMTDFGTTQTFFAAP